MKIIRFISDRGQQLYGAYDWAHPQGPLIEGDILERFSLTERHAAVKKILPPVNPPNILALGFSYGKHAGETESRAPESPVLFIKGTNSLLGQGGTILLPKAGPDEVDYEAELAVVIGKRAKNVSPKEAMEVVLGYTCGNDLSARDWQWSTQERQWPRGKSFDSSAAGGPVCDEGRDPGPEQSSDPVHPQREGDAGFKHVGHALQCSRDRERSEPLHDPPAGDGDHDGNPGGRGLRPQAPRVSPARRCHHDRHRGLGS